MSRFYIGSKLENHEQVREVRDFMISLGHQITFDWTINGSLHSQGREALAVVSEEELQGITDANIVIILLPGGRGTHVELGASLALARTVQPAKRIALISGAGGHEFADNPTTSAFYHNPFLEQFLDLKSFYIWVGSR